MNQQARALILEAMMHTMKLVDVTDKSKVRKLRRAAADFQRLAEKADDPLLTTAKAASLAVVGLPSQGGNSGLGPGRGEVPQRAGGPDGAAVEYESNGLLPWLRPADPCPSRWHEHPDGVDGRPLPLRRDYASWSSGSVVRKGMGGARRGLRQRDGSAAPLRPWAGHWG